MDAMQAAVRLRRAALALKVIQQNALAKIGQEALTKALALSSGNVTQQILSTPVDQGGLGAPYGHGPIGWLGPRGAVPNGGNLAIINKQTGLFYSRWRLYASPGTMILMNDAPYAGMIVSGTLRMKARPIDIAIMNHITSNFKVSMTKDIQDLFK